MKLMVQVAFDLVGGQKPQYDAIRTLFGAIGLSRTLYRGDGTFVELPANTYVSIRDVVTTPAAAIALVKEQLSLAQLDMCTGRAFITAVPFDGAEYDTYDF